MLRRRRRVSVFQRIQSSWQSVSYRRRQLFFKIMVGLLGSALSVLLAWMIVALFS